ncbi:MAG: DUF5107 domain-containing protein [Bacteroidetes bacterium]|jgi:hypothetical protein|nr:DUF5107 domain-containing protein [Bacteroidota bacterium]
MNYRRSEHTGGEDQGDEPHEHDVVRLESSALKLEIVPAFGGKISSLVDKQTGSEFLAQPQHDIHKLRPPNPGDDFVPPHAFGFDECFPNITPGTIQVNGRTIALHDHGELWSHRCEYEAGESGITLGYEGVELDYRFDKTITLENNCVHIGYRLENREPVSFDYIWSSHPLLNVQKGDELLIPGAISEMLINGASDEQLGTEGDVVSWPEFPLGNNTFDGSIVKDVDQELAAKFFTRELSNGIAGLYRRDIDCSLLFRFDAHNIPYLGIWLCYGGWPADNLRSEFAVALEPARGGFDDLKKAVDTNRASRIDPHEVQNWEMTVGLENGKYPV